eukprot:TRINITY_DN4325_c0_g1_i1.p1 TRINITY_DN4325_c0_g1~~TRINITY_DN4325_c0_g1_i1.p1  ORF type:complete len:603 (+),score=81.94 TRINITY_DN4325_c0_g1_i1:93-1901(+)
MSVVSHTAIFVASSFGLWNRGLVVGANVEAETASPRFLGRLPRLPSELSHRPRSTMAKTAPFAAALADSEIVSLNETLMEIQSVYGAEFVAGIQQTLTEIKHELLPVFAASPKNEHGRLDDEPARYAVRRIVMERHGWDMPSLGEDEIGEDTVDIPNRTQALGHSLPRPVREVFQRRLAGTGVSLLDLSLLVASLEQAALQETPQRLEIAYQATHNEKATMVDVSRADDIIDLYMGAYIMSEDLSRKTQEERLQFKMDLPEMYDQWAAARRLFRDIRVSVAPTLTSFSFEDVSNILRRIEKEFPFWNNKQCMSWKEKLMSLEVQGSGRVRLLDFYEGALHKGMVQFREPKEYLKALGALDESDPLEPRVIMSNYLDGPSNCVAETDHYSLCCIDECMGLYGHIERHVQNAEASPEDLISVVKHLSSSTMNQGRLSKAILKRIHDIAQHHEGVVPLHGALFAEWMHFAYPRECTYPQMFGRAHAQTLWQWEAETNLSSSLTNDQIRAQVEELEALDMQRLARVAEGGEDDSDSGGSCWRWEAVESNITFVAEEDEERLAPSLERSQGAFRWTATLLVAFCVVMYCLKLLLMAKPAHGFPKSVV